MKWTQLLWRLHEPHGGIPFCHLPHAIGQCEDDFCARKAWRRSVGRVGEACEIAGAYLFLMQEGYGTGQTVVLDGGAVLV
jgi:NAD(P)-dependent dehydrogenase (short-subunit alcohol dehydrogenase family)